MGRMDSKPRMSRLESVLRLACAMSRTCVSTQRSDSIYDCKQAGQDYLQVLVFNHAGIKAQIFSNDCPNGFEILLGWHFQSTVRNVDLADALKDIAGRGDCLAWVLFDIRECPIEFVLKSRRVKLLDEVIKRLRCSTERSSDGATSYILEFASGEHYADSLMV